MSTILQCSCGHRFVTKVKPRTRTVNCPSCGHRIAPGRSTTVSDRSDSRGHPGDTPPPLPPTLPGPVAPGVEVTAVSTTRPPIATAGVLEHRLIVLGVGLLCFLGLMSFGCWLLIGAARKSMPPPELVRVAEQAASTPVVPVEPEPVRKPAAPEQVVKQADPPAVVVPERPAPAPKPVKPKRRPLTIREVVAKSEASVAMIRGISSSGSGFVVAPGLVATNAHVIASEPTRRLEVHFPSATEKDRGPLRARFRYKDAPRDLALLEVETRLAPLELCRTYVFQRGEEVTVIGSPGLGDGEMVLKNAVNRGVVSTEVELDGQRFLQLGASVNPGNSGGPAFNDQGQVIGIVTARAAREEAIGFCIPVDDLIQAMKNAAAMTRDRIAMAGKMHDAESITRRLNTAHRLNDEVIQEYLRAMEAAVRVNESPITAVHDVKRRIGDKLAEANERLAGSIPVEVNELVADPDLPIQIRRDLEALRHAFDAMRRFVENPPEHPRLFLAMMKEVVDRVDEGLDNMARNLGIELKE